MLFKKNNNTVYQKQKPTVAQSKVVCNYVLQSYCLLSGETLLDLCSHENINITKAFLSIILF